MGGKRKNPPPPGIEAARSRESLLFKGFLARGGRRQKKKDPSKASDRGVGPKKKDRPHLAGKKKQLSN